MTLSDNTKQAACLGKFSGNLGKTFAKAGEISATNVRKNFGKASEIRPKMVLLQ